MNKGKVIDLETARRRKAAKAMHLELERIAEPSELENTALSFFHAITGVLEDGADPKDVDRLVDRLDRVLDAMPEDLSGP